VATRYGPFINQLRAALRGKHGTELLVGVRQHIEASTVAILVADNSSRYIAANAAAAALTGYSTQELLRMQVTDLTPSATATDGARLWEEFIAHGTQRGEYQIVPRTGRPIPVRYWAYASVVPGIHVSLLVPVE
jgi:PAS domain S-box-containing protein